MKRITAFAISAIIAMAAAAVPAKRTIVTLVRPDGTKVEALLTGNEHMHYYIDQATGEALRLDDDGFCRPFSDAEFRRLEQHAMQRRAGNDAKMANMRRKAATYVNSKNADRSPFDLQGERHALVILINFNGTTMQHSYEEFEDQINTVGYNKNNHIGSVHDYFYDQSYGQFDLKFDVVGPVTVLRKSSYYGKNDRYGDDLYLGTLVAEACELAYDNGKGVDFSRYDWDGDGEAEMVVCIYAGYSESQGASDNSIWPQQWYLDEANKYGDGPGAYNLGGTVINRFLVLNELAGTSGTRLDGIGTFCHEYSHGLGLPDLYDIRVNSNGYTTNFGMDQWDLMDSGSYNGGSARPCAYTAYERMFCGWLTPTLLSTSCEVEEMKPITEEGDAYIIENDAHPDEYFLLQNIQQTGWNVEAGGHGMLVMHIDYDSDVWYKNTINSDYNRQRCTIVPADNELTKTSRGFAGDPFPGTKNNHVLSSTSIPSMKVYNSYYDGKDVLPKALRNINEDNDKGTISFTFENNAPETPEPDGISHVANGAANHSASFTLDGRKASGAPGSRIVISNQRKQMTEK